MINKDIELILDKICRCCLCENENMHSMFDNNKDIDASSAQLPEMLMACASIEVSSGDGLPYNLCYTCETKLNTAFEFRKQCQKSDSELRELTNTESKDTIRKQEENIVVQPDVHNDLFDEEDDLPLIRRGAKRKRGRPRKIRDDSFPCTFCKKVLHTKKGLRIHLRAHTGEKMRQCLFCDAKYTRTNHLIRHISTHDKPGMSHPCESCDRTFTSAADLYRHSKEHEVKETTNDDKLDMKTDSLNSSIENSKKNVLNELNQDDNDEDGAFDGFSVRFSEEEEYLSDDDFLLDIKEKKEKRKKKTADDKDKALYDCKECTKVMTTYIGLRIHMRRHTGADLALCKLCNKTFTKQSHLNRHMRTHGVRNNEKTKIYRQRTDPKGKTVMECDFCDRKFKYRKSFVHHMQAEHGMSDNDSDFAPNEDAPDNSKPEVPVSTNNAFREVSVEDGVTLKNETATLNEGNGRTNITFEQAEDGENGAANVPETEENQLLKKGRNKNQVCHVCGASFARANHLTRHMTLHRALLVHQCDRCEKAFSTEDHLKKHVEEEHINKPYVCTVCNKPFSRGEHLIRHLKVHQDTADSDQAKLKCSICDLSFTRSENLARHTKVHLLQDKRHVCIECGKAFNRLDNLKTHQRIHTGVKDTSKLHLCIYCGKEFNNSSNMIVHMRRHTGERPYKCTECGKGFPRSHDLKCHERTHSGEKPYLCTLCGKSFNKSNKLLRHSRVHTGERPYVCNICSRAFTQSNDLALHMRRHTGARPYACGVCPARFIQSGQLKTHRRTAGHWMETQPDLKGGHRVEPVTPAHEPMPIRFKSHGRFKKEELLTEEVHIKSFEGENDDQQQNADVGHGQIQQQQQQQPQRILMGIMGNIKLQNDMQPLIIDSGKLVELHNAGLVNLPTVIQTANGNDIKLKTEVGNFNLVGHCEESVEKIDDSAGGSFQDNAVVYSTVEDTATTYTTTENFNFQNYQ